MATILCIEHEAQARQQLVAFLAKHAFTVVEAACAESAVQQFHAYAPDIVLSAIDLPQLPGYAMYERLHAEKPDSASRTAFIFLTPDAQETAEPLRTDLDHCAKPIDFDALLKRLRRRLSQPSVGEGAVSVSIDEDCAVQRAIRESASSYNLLCYDEPDNELHQAWLIRQEEAALQQLKGLIRLRQQWIDNEADAKSSLRQSAHVLSAIADSLRINGFTRQEIALAMHGVGRACLPLVYIDSALLMNIFSMQARLIRYSSADGSLAIACWREARGLVIAFGSNNETSLRHGYEFSMPFDASKPEEDGGLWHALFLQQNIELCFAEQAALLHGIEMRLFCGDQTTASYMRIPQRLLGQYDS